MCFTRGNKDFFFNGQMQDQLNIKKPQFDELIFVPYFDFHRMFLGKQNWVKARSDTFSDRVIALLKLNNM